MRHKTFTTTSLISFGLMITFAFAYIYIAIFKKPHNLNIQLILKPLPLFVVIFNTLGYFFIYRINFYALMILISLILCMGGDMLIVFYDSYGVYFLIIGGLLFVIARCLMILSFIFHPFKLIPQAITMSFKKVVLIAPIVAIFFTGLGIYFIVILQNTAMKILVFSYCLIMGTQTFFSLYRIREIEYESKISQMLGALGSILFSISDTLLFLNMFVIKRYYVDIISLSFYWMSIYFLGISIVRSKDEIVERGNINYIPL